MSDDIEYELEMPCVTVTSVGGPHDDESYVAGWQMGELNLLLLDQRREVWEDTIRTDCLDQADLIAMKHGYSATFHDLGDGWTHMELRREAE